MNIENLAVNDFVQNTMIGNDIELFRRIENTDTTNKLDSSSEEKSLFHRLDKTDTDKITENVKKELIDSGVSPGIIDKISCKDGSLEVKTTNQDLENKNHLNTGVPFIRKTVDVSGYLLDVVVPKFDSKFDAALPPEKIIASDDVQKTECNKQLKDSIQRNPELKQQFSERQLKQIESGVTPSGYVWHHNEEVGKMQLVDAKIHNDTNHTGGKALWGGGGEAR